MALHFCPCYLCSVLLLLRSPVRSVLAPTPPPRAHARARKGPRRILFASNYKCIASSNKCLTGSNKKLVITIKFLLLLLVRPGAPSSVLAPSSDAQSDLGSEVQSPTNNVDTRSCCLPTSYARCHSPTDSIAHSRTHSLSLSPSHSFNHSFIHSIILSFLAVFLSSCLFLLLCVPHANT